MNIVVCVKQVPDTTEVKIDPETNNLVREGVPSVINPYDACALEAALRIKEKTGGRVTAVSMGPPQAKEVLEYAVGMGADEGVLLTDRKLSGSDTLATGYALSEAVRGLEPHLVLCGSEAVDGSTGQVGPIIAERLGYPQFTYVERFEILDNGEILVYRDLKVNYEILSTKLPAVVCVLKSYYTPRKSCGKKTGVTVMDAAAAGMDDARIGIAGSPTRVADINVSSKSTLNYVVIDSELPAKERIRMIVNGGMEPKKINLTRGRAEDMAGVICRDEAFARNAEN